MQFVALQVSVNIGKCMNVTKVLKCSSGQGQFVEYADDADADGDDDGDDDTQNKKCKVDSCGQGQFLHRLFQLATPVTFYISSSSSSSLSHAVYLVIIIWYCSIGTH